MIHYTKSGKFAVVDVTDPSFCPGVRVPQQFMDANTLGIHPLGTWFFMPTKWTSADDGYGSFMSQRRGHPMSYSPGFDTAEQALDAAEAWEVEQDERNDKLTGWAKWRAERQATA